MRYDEFKSMVGSYRRTWMDENNITEGVFAEFKQHIYSSQFYVACKSNWNNVIYQLEAVGKMEEWLLSARDRVVTESSTTSNGFIYHEDDKGHIMVEKEETVNKNIMARLLPWYTRMSVGRR
jgi:hypothetical protein